MTVAVSAAEITQRTLPAIPIKLEGVSSGLTARILDPGSAAMDLTLSGAPTLLDQLDQDSISVVADVGGLRLVFTMLLSRCRSPVHYPAECRLAACCEGGAGSACCSGRDCRAGQ